MRPACLTPELLLPSKHVLDRSHRKWDEAPVAAAVVHESGRRHTRAEIKVREKRLWLTFCGGPRHG